MPSGSNIAILGSNTITDGGSPFTTNGQTFSLGPSGSVTVNNGQTQTAGLSTSHTPGGTLNHLTSFAPSPTQLAVFSANGKTYTAYEPNGSNTAIVNGNTFSVGGLPATVDGLTISLCPTGLVVTSHGQTSTLRFSAVPTASVQTHGRYNHQHLWRHELYRADLHGLRRVVKFEHGHFITNLPCGCLEYTAFVRYELLVSSYIVYGHSTGVCAIRQRVPDAELST